MENLNLPKYIGNKIRYYRTSKNYTQEELAKKINTKKATISNYETGYRSPQQDMLFQIANVLDISINDLFPDTTSEKDTSIESIYNQLELPRQAKVYSFAEHQLKEQNNPKVQSLSEYKEKKQPQEIHLQSKVSAGRGVVDLDPNSTDTITYYGKLPKHFDMAFKVDGNSMEPVFEDGDIIFVEKMDEIINGALMVVTIEDEAFIKKVYLDDDCIRLVSLNKEYDDIRATEGINVIGKVVF